MFYSYDTCRSIILKKEIKTKIQYQEFRKSSNDLRMPSNPNTYYKEWISWNHFLNKEKTAVLSYDEAVKYNRKNNIKTRKDYINHINLNKIKFLLKYPQNYKNWQGWSKFLSLKYLPYKDAVNFLSNLNFTSIKQYKNWIIKNKIDFLPKVPNKFYKEWEGWDNYFNKVSKFLSFHEAVEFLKNENIKTQREYKNWQKVNKINFLPNWPDGVYKEWKNWNEFLSTDINSSSGESLIEKYLKDNHIIYESQKRFKDCRNKKPLPFDFFIPEKNICIEFDGIQHYQSIDYFGGNKRFKYQKMNDDIKDIYCNNNKIKLIRIPYWDIKKISKILDGII